MMVPDLTEVAKTFKQNADTTNSELEATKAAIHTERNAWRNPRGHSKASALLLAARGAQQIQPFATGQSHDVDKRQLTTSTRASSGSTTASRATTSSSSVTSVSSTQTQNSSRPTSISASKSFTGTDSATATVTGPASTATGSLATPAPSCPAAGLSNFTDNTGIVYLIKCSTTNSGSAFETVKVDTGGYGQCLSSCSYKADCVGFSFIGNDSGLCYLRNAQTTTSDETALVSTYVTAYKLEPNAVASPSATLTSSASSSSKSKIGAIAGGVVGGVAAVALLLFLIAFFTRRKRAQIDERHAREAAAPVATQERYYDEFHQSGYHGVRGHQRQGSTANDVYSHQGGFPLQNYPQVEKKADHFSELEAEQVSGPTTRPFIPSPGVRAEGGLGMVPAAVLRPPQLLDSTPVGQRSPSQKNSSRTSIFRENISEMEDTSSARKLDPAFYASDSPILGHGEDSQTSLVNQVGRGQFKNAASPDLGRGPPATSAPKTPPSARSVRPAVSPDLSEEPRDSNFVVSPLPLRFTTSDRGKNQSKR